MANSEKESTGFMFRMGDHQGYILRNIYYWKLPLCKRELN